VSHLCLRFPTVIGAAGSVPGEGSYFFESTPEGTRVTSRVEMPREASLVWRSR
jgi:hypothetical protein